MATSSEIESLESLLEKAGERALDERELAEAKRILYGKHAQYVVYCTIDNIAPHGSMATWLFNL